METLRQAELLQQQEDFLNFLRGMETRPEWGPRTPLRTLPKLP